jgi:hypothetical protein
MNHAQTIRIISKPPCAKRSRGDAGVAVPSTPVLRMALCWGRQPTPFRPQSNTKCSACGRRFRVGLIGDAIGCLILGAFVGRVALESLFFGLFFMPLSLFLFYVAFNKIWCRLRYPVVESPSE